MRRWFVPRTGRDWSSWPVLLLLLTALLPSAGVVWMLRAALENEQLAMRQRLADAYRAQLDRATQDVERDWNAALAELEKAGDLPAGEAFQRSVSLGKADSVIVWDDADRVAYPGAARPVEQRQRDPRWRLAEQLEYSKHDFAAAAQHYAAIAAIATDETERARAEQAQARALLRAGDRQAAIAVLKTLSTRDNALDASGRSLAADAELRLLEISPADAEREKILASLRARVNNYAGRHLPADQRRFLMHRLAALGPAAANFSTLGAEELAAELLAFGPASPGSTELQPTPLEGVWSITTDDRRVTALYRTATLESRIQQAAAVQSWPASMAIRVRPAGQLGDATNDLMAASLAPTLPGWRLALQTRGDDLFNRQASRRRTLLLSIAVAMVGATIALTTLVAGGVRRQMHLARLKNDLVATVSHELKTPLASIRLLVDTLLNENRTADPQAREYLELISRENARLTGLIDNFLTFSRMERGKRRFAFEPLNVADVIHQAVAAVGDRFDGTDASLHVGVSGRFMVHGDRDALVTAVINLLDNAWKYSGSEKTVAVSAAAVGDRVLIEVADNGVGLTPRAARRVFERFYQADDRLSRQHGGCGLGLSIVKYIAEAHGGAVAVNSKLGEGSTFSISLPRARTDEHAEPKEHAVEQAALIGETE